MSWPSRIPNAVSISLLATIAFALCSSAQAASAPRLVECQHPVRTGEEVFNLRNITSKTACPVVLHLARWEYEPGAVEQHITALYRCVGAGKHSPGTPALKLHTFEGWRLSLTRSGAFEMSRGASSFDVTGTDFPLNCT